MDSILQRLIIPNDFQKHKNSKAGDAPTGRYTANVATSVVVCSQKIAFVWYRPEHAQQSIFIVNRDGSGLRQIVKTGANTPVWSSSANELAYSQATGNKSQIFKINLVTGGTTQLTYDGNNFLGDWFDPSALPVAPQPQLLTTTWGEMKIQN